MKEKRKLFEVKCRRCGEMQLRLFTDLWRRYQGQEFEEVMEEMSKGSAKQSYCGACQKDTVHDLMAY